MEWIMSYTQLALAELKWVERHKIPKNPHEYLPVIIHTASSKRNKCWYSVKYLDKEEVLKFIKNTKKSWKRKNKW